MIRKFYLIGALAVSLMATSCTKKQATNTETNKTTLLVSAKENLEASLNKLENVEVKKFQHDSLYADAYEIYFTQPLDHNNPAAGTFKQRVILGHLDFSAPMVVELQGYNIWYDNKAGELSKLLDANQLIIEHRFFGDSKPEKAAWDYLTIDQAAADQHRIIEELKKIYGDKWITTGISKGGQTTMLHRYFYPNDVDLSVPYVAPLNFAQEDPRIYEFLSKVGTEETRQKIKVFQRAILEKKAEVLPLLEAYAKEKEYSFKELTPAVALDYTVLEYPFTFFQWANTKSEDIPSKEASAEELFRHLRKTVPLGWYDDKDIADGVVAHYQFGSQLGYYGYETAGLEDVLTEKNPGNFIFYPKDAEVKYDPVPMQKLQAWLMENGDNFIYIYGGNDTWTACAIDLKDSKTNAVKYLNPEGSHATRIKHFPAEMKAEILSKIESLGGSKIKKENKENL